MPDSDQSRLVTTIEAARLLGKTTDAVRALVRRGTLETRPGNDGRKRIVLPPGRETGATVEQPSDQQPGDQSRPSRPVVTPDRAELLAKLQEMRAERDAARVEAAEQRDRASRAEVEAAGLKGELAAELRRNADLSTALDVERQERARLAAELAESRRPLLLRVVLALRRR